MYKEDTWVSREDLYKEVWAEPMIQVAKKYKISDVALKKACMRIEVPVPPRGYWAKLQAGKKVKQTPLGNLSKGKRDKARIRAARVPQAQEFRELDPKKLTQDPEKMPDLTVSDRLAKAHPLIQDSLAVLKSMRSRNPPMYEKTLHRLDVNVERASEDRAFRILDALFKALESEGHSVKINDRHKTELVVLDEAIGLTVRERKDKVPHVSTEAELVKAKREPWYKIPVNDQIPTGDLTIKLESYADGCRKSWSDGKSQRLETILPDVYVAILTVADQRRAERILWEQQRRKENEAAIRAAEIRLQEEKEEQRYEMLMDLVRSHRERAVAIDFIREVEHAVSCHPDQETRSQMARWLEWAQEKLDSTDSVEEIIRLVTTDEW